MVSITDVFIKILCLSLMFVAVPSSLATGQKIFNIESYGAKGDGETDNANAFLKAWNDACTYSGKSRLYVPRKTYYMSEVQFRGPCKGKIMFVIGGTLLAPTHIVDVTRQDCWINFRDVDNLVVTGGGIIDGQGSHSWSSYNYTFDNNTLPLHANMGFDFVKNSKIRRLNSLNSKAGHLNFFGVDNFNISRVNITAPGHSPNTDGLKFGLSSNIKIWDSHIGTGDDCIAILFGTTNFDIHNITCGPGHGISIGSLGRNKREKNVESITVRDSVFTGTMNGIRLKTWASPVSEITISTLVYENIHMVDVQHPIDIEQNYCPCPPCPKLGDSHIKISNVTFKNVWGTSTNKVAVSLQCSKSFPCKDIQLTDINLTHKGRDGPATASCENAHGYARGKMAPPSCLK